jgi:rhodanese-related sulfurtransferase
MRQSVGSLLLGCLILSLQGVSAGEQRPVGIGSSKMMQVVVDTEDGPVTIERVQDNAAVITGAYAKIARPCPPFCIQPMQVAEGVTTVGELELLDFLAGNEGVLIDARTEDWHIKETIPGSVNIPYTLIAGRLDELGCTGSSGRWDCAGAKTVALYCNGLWCGQSPMAIRAMIREGYPPERILYYRGGMQSWKVLGLTTVEGSL